MDRPTPSQASPAQADRLLDALNELNKSFPEGPVATTGTWSVDLRSRRVSCPKGSVKLSPLEMVMFARLIAAPDTAVSTNQLHEVLKRWGDSAEAETIGKRLRVYVSKMRAKFTRQGIDFPIGSVHGVGYKFNGIAAAESCTSAAPSDTQQPRPRLTA